MLAFETSAELLDGIGVLGRVLGSQQLGGRIPESKSPIVHREEVLRSLGDQRVDGAVLVFGRVLRYFAYRLPLHRPPAS